MVAFDAETAYDSVIFSNLEYLIHTCSPLTLPRVLFMNVEFSILRFPQAHMSASLWANAVLFMNSQLTHSTFFLVNIVAPAPRIAPIWFVKRQLLMEISFSSL